MVTRHCYFMFMDVDKWIIDINAKYMQITNKIYMYLLCRNKRTIREIDARAP